VPIDFPCPDCDKTLRVPDGAEGRQAQCPKCGHVVTVPGDSTPAAPPTPLKTERDAFADIDVRRTATTGDEVNPYSAPSAVDQVEDLTAVDPDRPLQYRKVAFSEALHHVWTILMDQLGTCVLAGLILFAVGMAAYMGLGTIAFLGMILTSGFEAFEEAGPPPDPPMVVMIPLMIVFYTGFFLFYAWLQAGMVAFFLGVARGNRPSFGAIFSGHPFILRMLAFNLLMALLSVPLSFCFVMPGIALQEPAVTLVGMFAFYPTYMVIYAAASVVAPPLIVDRRMSVFASLAATVQYMPGNLIATVGVLLVVSVLGSFLLLFTCGIGWLVVFPAIVLTLNVLYLLVTGQPTAVDRRAAARFTKTAPETKDWSHLG